MAKIILAGGSGFLGQALARRLAKESRDVVVLSRRPRADAAFREVAWDGVNGGAWTAELEGAAALVNFTGRSINCVHTPENRRAILGSRVHAVRALAQAWAQVANPPAVWLQCSATGYYGDAGDQPCDESAPAGADFLSEVCQRWEEAFATAKLPGLRRVVLRLGVVLDAEHGALPPLARLVRRYAGGAAGNGRQFMSWVHRDDVTTAMLAALTRGDLTGTYNLCAPAPVPNAEFMGALRGVLGRPWSPPAPAFAVRLMAGPLLGVDPALALHGQRALPRRLQAAGFAFAHPELGEALRDLLSAK
ncbi:TIGR01777 family oxidoreductase [Oleiharenicola lentus]|uniref:TIGR01777 family oxidoreductase n=1 Tax=Oleiharenicola lentus TaxID=2508720 RepID=UPI001C550F98|nr:TIGR01777 family oxidoreductase [Oleiharenicola lentus]